MRRGWRNAEHPWGCRCRVCSREPYQGPATWPGIFLLVAFVGVLIGGLAGLLAAIGLIAIAGAILRP